MALTQCFSCGAETENINGATHKYLLSTSGCWAKYGELLAREYSDFSYMAVHNLTVDAYAAQHPGQPRSQTISSINVHLSSLYAYFHLNYAVSELSHIKSRIIRYKDEFTWLEPPSYLGQLTVMDVLDAENAGQHCDLVKDWAADVFDQWEDFHPIVKKILEKSLG